MPKDYSLITLQPTQKEDHGPFWKFRVTEIWNQFKIYVIFYALGWLAVIVDTFSDVSTESLIFLMVYSLSLAL